MDTTYFLELLIGEYNPTTHRLTFETLEDAKAQLNALEPKMGQGKFRNDPENNRHRIISADGEMVVVAEHVQSARVVDHAVFERLVQFSRAVDVQIAKDRVGQQNVSSI